MANGRVITGYSLPYVALYANANGTISYSGGMPLARGVSVSADVESGDVVKFYANNVEAESAAQTFSGATLTLTVDGLKDEARRLIQGLPAAETVTVGSQSVKALVYDDRQAIPYVGIGFVVRYMSAGVTTYVPVIFSKASFAIDGLEAATQEESIEFQTEELEATVMRDDSATHKWKYVFEEQETEAAAESIIKGFLSIE